tara:strand:+ start:842 stop:1213 length:372 start_codon:yes stop_codon:yes gene_type:complete
MKEFDVFAGDRRMDMERGELLVADYKAHLCAGYLKLTSNEFFNKPLISLVVINEAYRSRGIGSQLIIEAIERASWHEVYLTTEARNTGMQRLASKLGFLEVGLVRGLNFDGEDELVFRYQTDQ